jgi:spore coat protein U-like protein
MLRINRLAFSVLVIGTAAVGLSTRAYAGSATSSMSVSVIVGNGCTISAAALNFGGYDPTSNAVHDGSAALSVTCTSGVAATIDLDQGANPNTGSTATAPLRRLKFHDTTDHFVSYQLYQDSSHASVWAAGTNYNVSYAGVGTLETVTAYAEIPGNQGTGTPAGTYTDTVNATVNF